MNLISCDRCGVVLDKDKLEFPEIYDPDTGEHLIGPGRGVWKDGEYVAKVDCPVCNANITR